VSAKRIVFGSNQLMSDKPTYDGQTPVFQGFVDMLAPTFMTKWSTGRLEKALALGMEAFVLSLKPALGPQDSWWRKIVPPENVFLYEELRAGKLSYVEIGRRAFLPWQRLFVRLGISWESRYESTDVARAALATHDVLDGKSAAL
jgi:hypothetical protein